MNSPTQGTRELVCLQGSLGELYAYGVLPNNFVEDESSPNYFHLGYSFCGLKNDTQIPDTARQNIETCTSSQNFKVSEFESAYEQNCKGAASCTINLGSYLQANADPMCGTDPARVYIQYRCSQALDAVNTKRVQGLAIVCLGILVSLLFLLTHWYL